MKHGKEAGHERWDCISTEGRVKDESGLESIQRPNLAGWVRRLGGL
jgi:hypothetical protein